MARDRMNRGVHSPMSSKTALPGSSCISSCRRSSGDAIGGIWQAPPPGNDSVAMIAPPPLLPPTMQLLVTVLVAVSASVSRSVGEGSGAPSRSFFLPPLPVCLMLLGVYRSGQAPAATTRDAKTRKIFRTLAPVSPQWW